MLWNKTNTTILVATANKELRTSIRMAGESLNMSIVWPGAESEREVWDCLKSRAHYDMIVSSAELPADDGVLPLPGEMCGRRILSSLRESGEKVPFILVLEAFDQALVSTLFNDLDTRIVVRGLDFGDAFCRAVRSLIQRDPALTRPKYIRVMISAEDSHLDSWRFDINDDGRLSVHAYGDIKLDGDRIGRLIKKSERIKELLPVDWEDQLREIGIELLQEIRSSTDFNKAFDGALPYVDHDMRRVKIWFRVGKSLYPIVLEALVPEEEGEKFWMLRAPIYRRLSGHAYGSFQEPLFSCGKGSLGNGVRSLIIEADATGLPEPEVKYRNGDVVTLEPLKCIHDECDQVYKLLKSASNFTALRRINQESVKAEGRSFKETVEDALGSTDWDLVHYSGHSLFDGEDGYLFFPSAEGRGPEIMRITVFAAYLTKTRFLFLSSCHSLQDSFVLALGRCNVFAVAGYGLRVHDEPAAFFATSLYRHLINDGEHCLQHAFVDARSDAFGLYRHDPVWVAPMLMVQAD